MCIHICVLLMCLHLLVRVHMCVKAQALTGCLPSSHHKWRQGLSVTPRSCQFGYSGHLACTVDRSHHHVLVLQADLRAFFYLVAAGDPNCSPHTCIASTFPTHWAIAPALCAWTCLVNSSSCRSSELLLWKTEKLRPLCIFIILPVSLDINILFS